jgi:type IX secretion system PorP/SprF family membrane protein
MKIFASLTLTLILVYSIALAQQDPQYTMYMFNRQVINPANSGANDATNVTLLGRTQWVGIDGAPNTFTASLNGPSARLHGGIGGYIMADNLGPLSTLAAKFQYAYRFKLPMENEARLHLGLEAGFLQKSLKTNWRYNQDYGIDPALVGGKPNVLLPDLGIGAYYYVPDEENEGRTRYYLGATLTHILEGDLKGFTTTDRSKLNRQFVFTGGYSINLNPSSNSSVFLEPSANLRTDGVSFQYDLNCNMHINPIVFGLSIRGLSQNKRSDLCGIAGFHVNDRLFLAYSYDYALSALGAFTSGSHELVLSYTFPNLFALPKPENNVLDKKKFN